MYDCSLPMHCDSKSSTVMAVEWMVGFFEARLGTRAVTTLFTMGTSMLPSSGTMLLKASRACRFTLLFLSFKRGLNASNTY